jgi:hypothetical protein
MSAPRAAAAVLADRLAVVLAIGAANAAQHRAQAALGGAQIALATLEDQGAGDAAMAAAHAE